MPNITKANFKIRLDEVNHQHQLTVSAIAGYLQEIAWEASVNTEVSIPLLLDKGLTWVLSRMRLEMFTYPQYAQNIWIETWAPLSEKFFVQRDFKIYDASSKLLGQASSNWLIVDTEKKRLIPVPDFIVSALLTQNGEPLPNAKEKIEDLKEISREYLLKVRWNDLDINQHSNNKHYFRWILDSLPKNISNHKQLNRLDIQFKDETTLEDELFIQTGELENNTFLHKIIRAESGKEIVRAASYWQDAV